LDSHSVSIPHIHFHALRPSPGHNRQPHPSYKQASLETAPSPPIHHQTTIASNLTANMLPRAILPRSTRPILQASRTTPTIRFRTTSRRWQSSTAHQQQHSWFRRMWESEVGFKTWALVLAGISDFARPAEKLSVTQNFALTCTGLIWTRWCLIIKPKNYLLAAVNFFLGIVGVIQLSRIGLHTSSQKKSVVEKVKS
ncbi:hypothetical protein CP533_4818, partial [Ophiocordyceps camponoti-saundersi (nom. inval.)]